MFTITAIIVIELLKEVTDNTLREKIIQLVTGKTSSSTSIPSDKKKFKPLKQNHIIYDHRLTRLKSIIAKRKNKVDNESINKKIFSRTL
ncbi:hypothetical protein H5410_016746 [Solanum commersonii]|uniref:Uncharacterized protein n=1 Tax=Solanum commersonii TaxID=4109 RepID=A0A9J5ZY63_SOLCO|nr:hypothetical protein H5410_016746 [Solanum commersonii]